MIVEHNPPQWGSLELKATHSYWCPFYFKKPMTFENPIIIRAHQFLLVCYRRGWWIILKKCSHLLAVICNLVTFRGISALQWLHVFISIWLCSKAMLGLVVAMASAKQHSVFFFFVMGTEWTLKETGFYPERDFKWFCIFSQMMWVGMSF